MDKYDLIKLKCVPWKNNLFPKTMFLFLGNFLNLFPNNCFPFFCYCSSRAFFMGIFFVRQIVPGQLIFQSFMNRLSTEFPDLEEIQKLDFIQRAFPCGRFLHVSCSYHYMVCPVLFCAILEFIEELQENSAVTK